MKISEEKYKKVLEGFKAIVGRYDIEAAKFVTTDALLWQIWAEVSDQMSYADTHPRFRVVPRLIPFDPEFDVYTDGVTDSHISAMLRKIGRELGLCPRSQRPA